MIKQKFIEGRYYRLTSMDGQKTIAYFYKNIDAHMNPNEPIIESRDYSALGFGFNIADGGGFLLLADLKEAVVVEEVFILTFYQKNGFKDREDYLEYLAHDWWLPIERVKFIAGVMGERYDFDGLPYLLSCEADRMKKQKGTRIEALSVIKTTESNQ